MVMAMEGIYMKAGYDLLFSAKRKRVWTNTRSIYDYSYYQRWMERMGQPTCGGLCLCIAIIHHGVRRQWGDAHRATLRLGLEYRWRFGRGNSGGEC